MTVPPKNSQRNGYKLLTVVVCFFVKDEIHSLFIELEISIVLPKNHQGSSDIIARRRGHPISVMYGFP